jgi:hypothetical protein
LSFWRQMDRKWRVRYARDRMAGLSEIGERGADAKHGQAAQWAIIGQSHDYKRNGTTTLCAAFEVRGGEVMRRHYKRRRRIEFLDFMNHKSTTRPSGTGACSALTKPPDITEHIGIGAHGIIGLVSQLCFCDRYLPAPPSPWKSGWRASAKSSGNG